jgi:pyridoxamine 5'-phosphate oxidase
VEHTPKLRGGGHRDIDLDPSDLADDPIEQVRRWYADAEAAGIQLPNAIALATVDEHGSPSVRHVLLRTIDARGFTFYTNRESRKGRDLAGNPRVAFAIYWRELDRQVCVTGSSAPVPDDESDAYFATRPREARIGAWASRQSSVIWGRDELMRRVEETDRRFPGEDVPRPPYWGGYLVVPDRVELWQGRDHRLHDRLSYRREGDGWTIERLSP